ncbi:hypothetical protein BOX15_Mlig014401g2 [Macrostomum lignano]|uniref:Ras-associating domain-containing protein n=2 Tax=Macrostomum lignano TaxID=282301 RepID=A0A1I8I4Y6_9PLAT|nr:hypothetical protein BOX15_Mlig014401g1 [Macrostomum lignano]PAA74638.1 hypothetical protein BOX15_Mlig014401g4 [Macrostomum lignano]PAA74645.1 hypothetical protein BOX15_Mlig014401g3 [Macrostomum lignano]PAA88456.1 hypothetical protein BOX15_Mlig014401g2 [Macrostomum lignano]
MVFVTVKHGVNEQTLFNQDCRSVTLLNAIREKCSLDAKDVIDLSDRDGNVKDLRKNPNMQAKEVLADREDVILLRVGENDKGKLIYTPLLESDEIVTKAFLDRLAKGSKRESHAVKGAKPGSKIQQQQQQHPSMSATSSTSSIKRASAALGQHKKR